MQRKEIAGVGIGKIVTGAIIVALALGVTIFYLFYTGRFGGGSKLKITSPTRVGYDYSHLAADNNIVSDYLFGRTKKLIVGKGGASLKLIGTYAREDLERMLGTKVYLNLWVKVKENWRESARTVGNFGYNEE